MKMTRRVRPQAARAVTSKPRAFSFRATAGPGQPPPCQGDEGGGGTAGLPTLVRCSVPRQSGTDGDAVAWWPRRTWPAARSTHSAKYEGGFAAQRRAPPFGTTTRTVHRLGTRSFGCAAELITEGGRLARQFQAELDRVPRYHGVQSRAGFLALCAVPRPHRCVAEVDPVAGKVAA